MKWVMCKQTLHDSVCYSTSENEDFLYLSYYSFLDYVHSLDIIDFVGFRDKLDKFEVLLINVDAKTWEVFVDQEKKEATFNDLLELNSDKPKGLSKIDRIKRSIAKFAKVKTYGGESFSRGNPDTSSSTVISRETRRGIRIPLKGERSRF